MMNKLNDDELDKVSGGWRETNEDLPTYGKNIVCPFCGNDKKEKFAPNVIYDRINNSVTYFCSCKKSFVVFGEKGENVTTPDMLNGFKKKR